MALSVGLEKARELAGKARDLYPRLKSECERQVVRWEWGSFTLHSLEPAYFEVNKARPGVRLGEGPDAPASAECAYGFDAQDRLVLERQRAGFAGQFYETFYQWEPGGTVRLHFDYHPEKTWIHAAWFSRDDAGRARSLDTVYARGGSSSEIYQYDAEDRIVGIECYGAGPDGDVHDFRDIEYDSTGRIVRVYWRYPDGRRILDFERPSEEQSFPAVRKELGNSLAEAIVTSLARLSLTEPVYALALWYCDAEEQHRLPPNISVGLEAERQRFVEEHGAEAPQFVWNPAEWEKSHIGLNLDERLTSQCESASQDIWQNDRQGEVDVFLSELAQQLATCALPFARTDDFVCYAINLDSGAYAEDVSSQAPQPAADLLRRRGLL